MSNVASLRQIRRRIRSVENTKKITRAMEMVAAAKLRRFQDFLESVRPYTEKLEELLGELLKDLPVSYQHPFLGTCSKSAGFETDKVKRSSEPGTFGTGTRLLVVFTSDTGLCGTYNSSVEEKTRAWLRENKEKARSFIFVGKHGAGALQKKVSGVKAVFSDLRVSRVDEILNELAKVLRESFEKENIGEIEAIYTHMESLTRYGPVIKRILPLWRENATTVIARSEATKQSLSPEIASPTSGGLAMTDVLVEPDLKTVLDRLIPAVFEARLRYIFYHALLTEQIARMSAMRQATQNAEEMVDELTLARNKARQASITKELIEIVAGSRALKLK